MKSKQHAKSEAKRLFRQCFVNGTLDEDRARELINSIIATGRRDSHELLAWFLRLAKLDRPRRTAKIESAVPLPLELKAKIEAGLTRRFGPGLTTIFMQRPELLGGVRVQVGYDLFDDTVLARLEALGQRFESRYLCQT